MSEDSIFEDALKRWRQDEMNRRAENVEEALPKAKEIIDKDFKFDGSRVGSTIELEGPRVSIYKKDNIFFLGYTNGYKGLFLSALSVEDLLCDFYELNAIVD